MRYLTTVLFAFPLNLALALARRWHKSPALLTYRRLPPCWMQARVRAGVVEGWSGRGSRRAVGVSGVASWRLTRQERLSTLSADWTLDEASQKLCDDRVACLGAWPGGQGNRKRDPLSVPSFLSILLSLAFGILEPSLTIILASPVPRDARLHSL